jgi:hypothetical protein
MRIVPAIRRSVCPEPAAGRLSPVPAVPTDFQHRACDREIYGSGCLRPRAALSWLIEDGSVDGVRRQVIVGFMLVAVGLAACHFVDCLAQSGCLASGPGEHDWMGPSVVGFSADPRDLADLGK